MPQPEPLVQSPEPESSHLLKMSEAPFFMNHIKEQEDIGPHHHEPLEMAFVVGGSALQRTTFGDYLCKPGQVYLVLPGMWHAYERSRAFELYNCMLSKPLMDGPLAWALEDPALGALLNPDPWHGSSQLLTWEIPEKAIAGLRQRLEELKQAFYRNPNAVRADLVGQMLLLFDYTVRHGRPNYSPKREPVHSAVRRAALALRNDLARPWTLPELADELRINPSYLVRIFRQATGCAPMKFLARERSQKAAQLLLTTRWPISQVGEKVGWDEPKQFARAFHRHFGESATEFRRRFLHGELCLGEIESSPC